MLNPIAIFIISAIITGIHYMIEFDVGYWICVITYAAVYSFLNAFVAAIELSTANSFYGQTAGGRDFLYLIITEITSLIIYFLIGMGVVYVMQNAKDSEPKTAIAIGVIAQIGISIVVNKVLGGVLGFIF